MIKYLSSTKADYCSQSNPFSGPPDINLFEIALNLKKGHSENILCEGHCTIRSIYKDEKGNLFLAKQVYEEIKLFPVKIEDLMWAGKD